MLKQNKGKLILASILILLPALFGAIVWNRLPEQMAMHWAVSDTPDAWGSRLLVVLLLPLLLLALFWIGMWATARDHRHREQNDKVLGMVFWILPLISLWANGIIYATAFGMSVNMMIPLCALLGVLFLIMGNYMPKCRPNRTVGIKIKWTLGNEENWSATHRFAGKIWCVCGLLFLICAFLPMAVFPWVTIGVILLAILPVTVYSYTYARKQLREGRAKAEDFKSGNSKAATVIAIILVSAVLIFASLVMFTGSIEIRYDQTSFGILADYYGDRHIAYDAIWEIEYREDFDKGNRTAGFGSARLSMGYFQNDEFGAYNLYAYTATDSAVVLKIEGNQTVVLSGENEEATRQIFEELSARMTKR